MRKQQAEAPYEVDLESEGAGPIPHGQGGGHRGESHRQEQYIDPFAPLPGAIKMVREQRTPRRANGQPAKDQNTYSLYLEELVRCGGDVASALATVLNIPMDEAIEKRHDLHAEMLSKGTGRSVSKILRESDLNAEGRIAVLRSLVHSGIPAAQLRAIDLLSEMDSGRGEEENASYESYVRARYSRSS